MLLFIKKSLSVLLLCAVIMVCITAFGGLNQAQAKSAALGIGTANASSITLHSQSSQIVTSSPKHSPLIPNCVVGRDGQCYVKCVLAPSDNNCTGYDPIAGGCDDGQTIQWAYIGNIGKLNLRWSAKCHSNWVQVVTNGQVAPAIIGQITRDSDGASDTFDLHNTSSIYTNMVYAPNPTDYVKAYGSISLNGSSPSACFDQNPNSLGCGGPAPY